VLVPSLINPPRILDLDEQTSLIAAVARMGRRALLLDWGEANQRAELDVAGHVEHLLLPLLRNIEEPVALVGYCLGGTMAIAAANLTECERVVTLAAPWSFAQYPESSRAALRDMWRHAEAASQQLGALPMEVLQASFWSLDPERTVAKFAEFGRLDPTSADAQRFVQLEDWANEGEPLPYLAAKELIEGFFEEDLPGSGSWQVAGRAMTDQLGVPLLNFTAERDRIAPASTVARGETISIAAGHVGMIVGSARTQLHDGLRSFLDPLAANPTCG
jgi:polyhydroxyalkanoate synthase